MEHEKINYIEFASRDLPASKAFFQQVFNWQFTDYGPEYSAFHNAGIDGGFFPGEHASATVTGGALVIFYSENLEATQNKILEAKGIIVKEIFSFPGGRRFHFMEPGGNELAVWSDQ